jgi:hypothetical protein
MVDRRQASHAEIRYKYLQGSRAVVMMSPLGVLILGFGGFGGFDGLSISRSPPFFSPELRHAQIQGKVRRQG